MLITRISAFTVRIERYIVYPTGIDFGKLLMTRPDGGMSVLWPKCRYRTASAHSKREARIDEQTRLIFFLDSFGISTNANTCYFDYFNDRGSVNVGNVLAVGLGKFRQPRLSSARRVL